MVSQSESQKTVLVIDDERDILDFLHALLELEGYRVFVSTRGDSLEKMLPDLLPDLILLDVFLSGKDGRQIVKDLKAQGQTKEIPVMLFSAQLSVEETALAAGADAFLAKPFNMDELLSKVHALLQS